MKIRDNIATLNDLNDSRLRIVLFLLFCVYLRPSADHLVNDLGLLYERRPSVLSAVSKEADG